MSSAITICPRCCQGAVVLQRVKATAELVQICEECEAVWTGAAEIRLETFTPFDAFMSARDRSDDWLRELEEPSDL